MYCKSCREVTDEAAALALGIGATTALFGVFRAVFLEPLPVPEPERLVLANGAALLVQSYAALRGQESGFEADGVLTVSIVPSGDRYSDPASLASYYDQVLERVGSAVGAVINQHFAEEAWPGEDPIGKRFSFDDEPPGWRTVVGVVEDVRQWGLEQPPISQAYFPLSHGFTRSGYLTVRTAGDPAVLAADVRRAILEVDPTQAPGEAQTMTSRVDRAFGQRRFYTTLIGLFAGAALFLAAAGVYGTVSYYVARRTRELGVRMALGAGTQGITRLVLGRSARLAARGVLLGLLGVWATTSLTSRLVYGVGAFEPVTLAGGCVALATVTLLAAGLPARLAARVTPVQALRAE